MKTVLSYITEKLKIKKGKSYKYYPKNIKELKEIIQTITNNTKNNSTGILDLTSINVSEVESFESVFENFYSENHNTVDISGWDVTNASSLEKMFINSSFKKIIGFNTLNLSKIKSLRECFAKCSELEEIEGIEKISINNYCNQINWMFYSCKNLQLPETLDWDVSGVEWASGIFNGCVKIEKIDLSKWDMKKPYTFCKMFYQCQNLKSIKGIEDWNLGTCKDASYMFSNCVNLETVGDISNWNVAGVKNFEMMFDQCKNLKCDLSSWVSFYPRVRKAYMCRGTKPKIFIKPKL